MPISFWDRLHAIRILAAVLLTALSLEGAERWSLRYFYDRDENEFQIQAFRFASPRRGVAAGMLVPSKGGKPKPMSLVTSDAGATWSEVELREPPLDVFFLDESAGWLVSDRGLWFTDEAGRSWRKILDRRNLFRTWFVTREHGWVIGKAKTLLETRDAGKTWNEVPLPEVKTSAEYTAFQAIAFVNGRTGLILGHSRPPRREAQEPLWAKGSPERAGREWPSLLVSLETRDGGETWKPQVQSVFGSVGQLALSAQGRGLLLLEYLRVFAYRSEIVTMNLANGKSATSFRSPRIALSDLLVTEEGVGLAAGVDVPGKLRIPVPYKVKMLKSTTLDSWQEVEVDYRAVARRVLLSRAGNAAWAATDTGMILQLANQ